MKDIKVSIIVAVYNGAKTLPRCLDSLVNQTYPNIEIICVNDCSPDNSLQILNEYQSKYAQIRIMNHESNKHGGGSGNTGMKNSTGDYVCIVDQDDALYPYSIEKLVENSHNGQDDIVLGQWCTVDEKGVKEQQENGIIGNDLDANIRHALKNGVRILGGLFKPSLFRDHDLYYPEHVNFADNAIYNAILIAAHSISVIDANVYDYYCDTVGSSSKTIRKKDIENRIYTTNLCVTNCLRMDKNKAYTDLIYCRYLYLTRYTIELLGYMPLRESKPIAASLLEKINTMRDNLYIKECSEEYRTMLLNPVEYLKVEDRKRKKRNVNAFFHGIRHSIVVMIKKMVGMDPTKSIYAK